MYRREFLETSAAALAVSAAGAGTASGTTTSTGSKNGRLVVIYDDAPIEDYRKAFPVHKELDVPGCVAPVSTWVGSKEGFCTVDQLREMKNDAGFEVMSQTREHVSLTAADIVRDVEADDAKVYPEFNSHAFHPGYSVEITDGETSVTRKVSRSGEDEHGVFIKLANEVGTDFDADDPNVVERYPDETMKYILSNSQAQLRHMGFRAENLVAPYDRFSPYAKQFVEQYYTGVGNANGDTDGLNDPASLDPYGLSRWYFIESGRRRDRFHRLDTIARENTLGIFGAHTYKEDVTAEKIRELLQGAKDRGIEVVTLREALQAYGVTESSTPTPTDVATPTATATEPGPTATPTDNGSTGNPTPTPSVTPTGDASPSNDNSTGDGGIIPEAGNEGLNVMAVLAAIGATIGGLRFMDRE